MRFWYRCAFYKAVLLGLGYLLFVM